MQPIDAGPAERSSLAPPRAVLIVLGVLLFAGPLAFNLPLTDPDEGLHASIALEMVERGDYLVPRLLGEPFLDKPVLFFLTQAISIAMFGANEFAVRLPGQLFGLLGVLTTGWLGAQLATPQLGVVAACIYATLLFPLALNQAPVHDVALVPWINLGFLLLVAAIRRPAGGLVPFALAGVSLSLAVLTKGLVGVALVGLPVAIITLLERRLSWRVIAGGIGTVVLAASLAVPWYLVMERADPGYLRYFFLERHVMGFATTTQLHGQRPWWYYLPLLAAGSLPWGLSLLGSRRLWPAWTRTPVFQVAIVWLVADLVFLTAAGSKLATYILPLFTPLALSLAALWTVAASPSAAAGSAFRRGVQVQLFAGAAILPVASLFASLFLDIPVTAGGWTLAAAIAVAWGYVSLASTAWTLAGRLRATATLVVATVLAAYASLFPGAVADNTARDLAAYLNQQGALPAHLWILDERVGSVLFYLRPELRTGLTPDRVEGVSFGRALTQGGTRPGTVLAIPRTTMPRLLNRLELADVPYGAAGRYRVYDAGALRNARPKPVNGAPVH